MSGFAMASFLFCELFNCKFTMQNKIIKFLIVLQLLIIVSTTFASTTPQSLNQQNHHKQINKNAHKKFIAKKKNLVKKVNIKPMEAHPAQHELSFKLMASIEQRLVHFIHNMIATLNYSSYKLGGTRFDLMHGVYILDCSSYVDFILKTIYPHAFSNLVNYSSSRKPTTHDYYSFFTNMIDEPQDYWSVIEDVEQLRPGDILVFRYRNTRNESAGHVMIVMDTPVREKNTFFIRIADSAPHRHSRDTRLPSDSGIGIGTLLIKVDSKTFRPSAYAWKIGSRWRRHVNFAMARPIYTRSV